MSHFTVLVIGNNIEEQLEKYSENTENREYLEFISQEAEEREKYEVEGQDVIILSDGSTRSPYDDAFRDSKDYLVYKYPEGSRKEKIPFKKLYSSFEEYMEIYCGNEARNEETEEYGYWSNPNGKWDWWSIGGRWSGFFKPKAGATGLLGKPGSFNNQPKSGWVDQITLDDIDFEAMTQEAINMANKTYDDLEAVLNGRELPSWNVIREKHGEDIKAARDEYNGLVVVQDLNKAQFFVMGDLVEIFGKNREEYIQKSIQAVGKPFAVLMDGNWIERGKMHMFGVSSDEMPMEEWYSFVNNLYKNLPPDTMITLVDCHN